MKDKIKVLVLASWYPSRVKPHLGTFVQRQAEAAAPLADMSVLFVCADPSIEKKYDVESKQVNGVFTVNAYYRRTTNPAVRAWRYFHACQMGWKEVKAQVGTPELVQLNILWPAGFYAYYLKISRGIKYILTENWTGYLDGDGSYRRSGKLRQWITRRIACGAEIITPVSRDLEKAMASHGLGKRFQTVYNAVDTSVFFPPTAPPEGEKTIFLHVSTTLDKQKNVTGILTAVKQLSEKRKDFILKIISEADFSVHEKKAGDLGLLNGFVFFESARQSQGVAEEMRRSHVFLLFSNYENLPVVILEAMSSGLPVISSTAGGVPEHITPEFGMLVAPGAEPALASAMEKMITGRNAYDANSIRQYAEANFSFAGVGKRFYEVYQQAFHQS